MAKRTVVKTDAREEMLVRYALGQGAYPVLLEEGKEYPSSRIVETWVPASETFVKNGQRYYRLISGHGTWTDIPIDD